jgi:ATP-dependent protease Clp ATPase subunit
MWWRKKVVRPERRVLRCSFCNKRQHDVPRLIAGPRVFICDECVAVCNDIIADDKRFVAGSRALRPEEPITWPGGIQCALCHVAIRTDEGVVIGGNRGTLCLECVKAVVVARPQEGGAI